MAGQIVTNLKLGQTFVNTSVEAKRYQNLSVDDISPAFRKHIDPKKLVIIRAADCTK